MFHRILHLVALVALCTASPLAAADGPSRPQIQTSEEYPPLVCPPNTFVASVHCDSHFCDNVGLTCRPIQDVMGNLLPVSTGAQMFTAYVSEEEPWGAHCPGGYAMVGVACSGSYCDRVSLMCAHVVGATIGNCGRSHFVSEETPPAAVGARQVITGVQCRGEYCDEKTFIICDIF